MAQTKLTDRQREIFDYVREFIATQRRSPTVRELGTHFEIASPNGVIAHLKALEKKGLITREAYMSRSIQLTEPLQPLPTLPLIGQFAPGQPLMLSTAEEPIEFGGLFASAANCCLRVIGGGIPEGQIAAGDYLVVRRQAEARDGDLVLGTLDNGQTIVKRVYRESQRYRLESLDRTKPPEFTPKLKITGLIVGIIRQM